MTSVRDLWRRLKTSLWLVPSILTVAACLLAQLTLSLDHGAAGSAVRGIPLIFSAGADGARGVLATIAGSIITVTGVVFSITIVALQLASSQFTPRVLRSFTEDRANQIVLGVFIGTFTYSLLILRSVRSTMEDYDRFIPAISVTCAIALCLVSIGFLIFFITHIASSIRAEVILQRVTRDACRVVERLYPESRQNIDPPDSPWSRPPEEPGLVTAAQSGYVQSIDLSAMVAAAEGGRFVVEMQVRVGDFVIHGDTLAAVWPRESCAPAAVQSIRGSIHTGAERTNQQDAVRGLVELTDIGVRALSPGINDPTTALVSIDRITEVLSLLAARQMPRAQARDSAGTVRVVGRPHCFDEIAIPPYAALRHHGSSHPAVALHLVQSMHRLATRIGEPERRRKLMAEMSETVAAAERTIVSEADLRPIRAALLLAP